MVRRWWPESSAEGQRSRTLSYSEWAEALADQFFPPSTARRPVRFAVDDDILDEIAETQDGQGARSLAAAVRPQLRLAEPRRLYDDVLSNAYAWTSGPRDGAPPFLPCLAVCVLAAARMDSKQGISASNYYSRLREVLDVNVSASVGYPDAIPSLFRLLHEWLERTQRGRRGQSTIPDSPKYAHIGFALSQVSFRESDRRKLTRFFAQLGLKSRDSSAAPLLVGRLREWASTSDLSSSARSFVERDEYRGELVDLISGELADWDETERDEQGRRVGTVRLLLDVERRPRWGILATRPDDFPPEADFVSSDGLLLSLSAAPQPGYYMPAWFNDQREPLLRAALSRPVMLRSAGLALRFAIDPITPLQPDSLTGKLIAVRRVEPGQRHWILIRSDQCEAATELLSEIAREGWADKPDSAPDGWSLLSNVTVDLPPRGPVPPLLEPLVPAVDARPELRGGLPVAKREGDRVYLLGGEPDLWLPEWMLANGPISVVIDGHRIEARGARLELSLQTLEPGSHTIEVGASVLRFLNAPSIRREPPTPEEACRVVVHPARADAESLPPGVAPRGEWVCGAVVRGMADRPTDDPEPLLLPYGAQRYRVIGAQIGDMAECHSPQQPAWLKTIDILPQDFEVYATFEAAWVAIEWEFRGWEIRRLGSMAPGEPKPSADARRNWADAVVDLDRTAGEAVDPLWEEYVDAAWRVLEGLQ